MQDSAVGMTPESYYEMCEALGTEPVESEIPIELHSLPDIVQRCFALYRILPDIWDTMGGNYLGKDYSIVFNLFEVYLVEEPERLIALEILQKIDSERSRAISEKLKSKSPAT